MWNAVLMWAGALGVALLALLLMRWFDSADSIPSRVLVLLAIIVWVLMAGLQIKVGGPWWAWAISHAVCWVFFIVGGIPAFLAFSRED